jgi:plastocyanin
MHARTAKPLAAVALALVLPLALAACGDDSGSSAKKPDSSSDSSSSSDEVTITAKDFSLTSVTAKPGEEVYVDNQGSSTHTVTADDGSFDTGQVAGGKQAELEAPDQPGTYAFHCSIHPNMTGTLTVAS